jgi:epoxyqueuosine reductase
VKRTGRNRFVRNVLIAAGNSGDRTLVDTVRPLLGDVSPLVRGMAVWAFFRLACRKTFEDERAAHIEKEPDAGVRAEWMTEAT